MAPEDRFDDAALEALKDDVPRSLDVAQVVHTVAVGAATEFEERLRQARVDSEELLVDVGKEDLKKLRQQHTQRTAFFRWATVAISGVLVASAGFMITYMALKGPDVEASVMIAWLGSGLVETLGLGYIIANYLFAGNGKSSATKS